MRNRNSRSRGWFHGGVVIALALAGGAYAPASAQQWATNGNDINNTNSGNVGVGTTTPQRRFHVIGPAGAVAVFPTSAIGAADVQVIENNGNANTAIIAAAGSQSNIRFVKSGASSMSGWMSYTHANDFLHFGTNGSERMVIDSAGKVGIGTTAPAVKLDVGGWTGMPGDVFGALANFGGVGGGDAFFGNTGAGVGRMRVASYSLEGLIEWNVYYNGSGLKTMDTTKPGYEFDMNSSTDSLNFNRYAPSSGLLGAPQTIMMLGGNGRVGIGTTAPAYTLDVNGTIRATQVIGATYQDFAEWVPAATKMAPGTVVVLNPKAVNEVMPSTRAYDTMVAGVVSANPGVILGEAADSKAQIATTGRVRVHVDATHSPIGVGDLLVTGDKTGTAIKSEPIEIAGRKFHQPGTIVGKALEPLTSGQGDILVLLSLQ